MAQFARPNADASIGAYEDELGGTSDIFNSIDEASPNDSDFITSEFSPSSSPYVCGLSSVTDPLSSIGHVVRYRARKDPSTGAQIDLTVELREGYVNEGSPGTLIATDSQVDLPTAFTTFSFALSGGEADAITDYSDLFLRFVSDQP